MSKVYFIKEINPENLLKIYDALGVKLDGKVGVKISTGEPGGHNYLQPTLIAPLVNQLSGTIIECNTAYRGRRFDSAEHLKAIHEHGFDQIAPVDVMDEEGEVALPVNGGKHLKNVNYVGKNLMNYDSVLILSHFKGHAMGGFGGALKNIAIGMASRAGKSWIHSAGFTKDPDEMWQHLPPQDDFLESMAEACKAVIDHYKGRIAYVSVANNLSVDCDCDSHPEDPKMADIGILASLDPVALDKACVDLVYASNDEGKKYLIERMETRHGIHTVEEAENLKIGVTNYELIELK